MMGQEPDIRESRVTAGGEPMLLELDLGGISLGALRLLLMGDPGDTFLLEVLSANRGRPEILEILRVHPNVGESIRAQASEALSLPVPAAVELEAAREAEEREEAKPQPERAKSLFQQIKQMKVGERMVLAMRGGREVRTLLLKDTNKEIVRMVLQNPKLSESEVEMISKNRNISEEVLRSITKNREWMKNYSIIQGLVTNPKTPAGLATGFVARLGKSDLRLLSQNRGVSELVRSAARKALSPKKRRE